MKKAISDLKVGKAAGHDILINELYIKAMDILTPKLVCLFITVFQSIFFSNIVVRGNYYTNT